jgi:HupE / UreJ protein
VSGQVESYLRSHGIGGGAADASAMEFVRLGFEHMLLGWDHLLFIAGMIVVCRNWWLSVKMISLFVLGHSATLILASVLDWGLHPTLVDLVIAMSVLFVAFFGVSRRAVDFTKFGVVVLSFGLIHGLGLAARLDKIGLPDDGKLTKVIAFNIGIELGQLSVVLGYAALGFVAAKVLATTDRARQIASGRARGRHGGPDRRPAAGAQPAARGTYSTGSPRPKHL